MYDLNKIKQKIKGNYECLILFGSYSRGDQKTNSDIDILQISDLDLRFYSFDNCNVSVYSMVQLLKMGEEGNLFLLHIIEEGKYLFGNPQVISQLKLKFKKRENYNDFRKDILIAAKLLDLKNEEEYEKNWKGYNNLLCFLFRSYLYSVLYDSGKLKFSLEVVSIEFNDSRILKAFDLKKNIQSAYWQFVSARSLFESYANSRFLNEYSSSLELIEKIKTKSKFLIAIGSHFIKDILNSIEY